MSVCSRLNWNLNKKMFFEERERPEYLGKNLSKQKREPTTNWYGVDAGIGTRVTSVGGEYGSHHCATVVLRNRVFSLLLNNSKFSNWDVLLPSVNPGSRKIQWGSSYVRFICFMILKLIYKIVLILSFLAFNDARGYQMERENYLDDLKTKTPKRWVFVKIRKFSQLH